MIPHSYTVDSLSQSQDLASKILSSSTPQQIVSTCASIDSFLHSHSSDHSRHFFSITFPALILKLFGFSNDSSTTSPPQSSSWVDVISSSNDRDLAARVFQLLSPNGVVFKSIYSVDRNSFVKFVFPIERLPEWARYMLSTEKDVKVLSNLLPIFKGKIIEDSIKGSSSVYQVQLNVFEYYMFWFAYYPISRGNNEVSLNTVLTKKTRKEKFRLDNWTNSIPGFSGNVKRGDSQKIECDLYSRLLYAYLREFVPISDLSEHQQPYRSSLLNYSSGSDGSVMMLAEFFVNVLVSYWLIDNDFSPLSVNLCKLYGVSYPIRSLLGDTPPTSGLADVVKLFVKYLNLSSAVRSKDSESSVECSGTPKRSLDSSFALFDSGVKTRDLVSVMPSAAVGGSWNASIQRPLYRYILRTFLFCPIGSSIKNASDVFSVWVSYMEPWNVTLDDFAAVDEVVSGSSKNGKEKDGSQCQASGYSPAWEGYVLSNYLYYSSLVMHFIGFAHKFLHTDPQVIVRMVLKVMNILTSSKELINLVKNVDTVFHSKQSGLSGSGKSKLNSLYRFVPSIQEQLQDWEDGLCESDVDGSFLHENWNKNLRLFSDGEDGGQQLLQLFIMRAEVELEAISGGNSAGSIQCIDSLKSHVSSFFGGHAIKPIPFSLEAERQQSRDEIFKPKRVGNHVLANIKYKGDWMRRPISDDEIAWLAKLLIWLSDRLNESLGLNQPESSVSMPKWSYVEISGESESKVYGSTDAMKTVLYAVRSCLMMMMLSLVNLMRKHGLKVNLRIIASKKIVAVLLLLAVFSVLKRAIRLLLLRA